MNLFPAALWAEALKAWRSKVPWVTALGFAMIPLAGGLFMFILKYPESARSMGIVTAKAQILAGVADWPALLNLLVQGTAMGGSLLCALMTAWVFGREFSDHTAKELLALPTPRAAPVAAKFLVILVWAAVVIALSWGMGLLVGAAVDIPGWSADLVWRSAGVLAGASGLSLALMPLVALVASAGRGYLPPMGWAILTMALAQIIQLLGWGSWFPWAVPALFTLLGDPRAADLGPHSYLVVALACAAGLAATFAWWQRADQSR